MSLLDDDLIDKMDLYIIESQLKDFLSKYNWYDDVVNSRLPVTSCYFIDKDNRFKMFYQGRYEIQIYNEQVKLIRTGPGNRLILIFEDTEQTIESIPDYILNCLELFEIIIHYGKKT